jgi:hypothetical protein
LVAGRLQGSKAGQASRQQEERSEAGRQQDGSKEEGVGRVEAGRAAGIWVFENWRVSPRKKLRGTAIL